jgi:hypothetical protein
MAVTIDSTVGGASANSYVTLAEAEVYFEGRLNITDWTSATTDEKNRALVMAARRLDQERWTSEKASSAQALKWPRWDAEDEDGNSISSDTIPEAIKDAQCELALAMLDSDLTTDTGLEGFDEVKVGPVSVKVRHQRKAGEIPEEVYREIRHWLRVGRGQARLMKA